MLQRFLVFCILFAIWFVLSATPTLVHLTMGVMCSGLVTWISGDLIFAGPKKPVQQLLGEFWRFFLYIPWLMKELVIANLHVLRLALAPGGPRHVRPRIVRYKTYLKSDFARFLFANSITVTPGTITILMEDDEIFIHAISEHTERGLEGSMEARIARIYGEEKPAA